MTEIRPIRLQLRRIKGFNLQALSRATNGLPAISCARPGRWGNRYRIRPEVQTVGIVIPAIETIEQAVTLHREWLKGVLDTNPDYLAPLRGHNLACWCNLDATCHADTLLQLSNR